MKHETCVLPHSLTDLNGGDVCQIKHDDLSVTPAFPLVKCETEVSSFFYILLSDNQIKQCHYGLSCLFRRLAWI